MTYRPREFWQERLSQQFDLRGTGEPGLSLEFNRRAYALRRHVLERALARAGVALRGRRVLDVGCGTGFFTRFYLDAGAQVTGLDLTPASVERLARELPQARFVQADIGEASLAEQWDVVNAFDVLYHITDDARWEHAVRTLARAVAPGGVLLITDLFAEREGLAAHNVIRSLARYRGLLRPERLTVESLHPTHVLLNRELGPFRFLNRAPALLYAVDRVLLASGMGRGPGSNKLLVARAPTR